MRHLEIRRCLRNVSLNIFAIFGYLSSIEASAVTFVTTYQQEAGSTWSDEAKAAFTYALNQWQDCLTGDMEIKVRAQFLDLPGNAAGEAHPAATRDTELNGIPVSVPIPLHGILTGNHAPATAAEADPGDEGFHISIKFDKCLLEATFELTELSTMPL